MNSPLVLIKSIAQKDNHTFTIHWSDGIQKDYRLSELQHSCPCAHCREKRKKGPSEPSNDSDVKAIRITSVGRYALKVKFTSGCSNGIFSYAMLRGD